QSSHCRAALMSSTSGVQFKQIFNPFEHSHLSLYLKCLARIKSEREQTFPYIRRCYYFIFIPTSFWPRLSTRLIGDT
ncbi:unnamed protein product, partial [Rotaria sp. Silwood1]